MTNAAADTPSPPQYVPVSLLRQMIADPSTRAQLESDPVAAFAKHGIQLPSETRGKVSTSAIGDLISGGVGNGTGSDTGVKRWSGFFG
ncbi:MAG: hypothetical protein MI919_43370 [Holophagales bacterium]|nr:hypothetical protein [Holophagales bacterium]